MVVIRLSRRGANKRPFYHIVAADSRRSVSKVHIQKLGYYNPLATGAETRIDLDYERYQYWEKQGAQPSDRVKSIIKDFVKGNTGAVQPSRKEVAEKHRNTNKAHAAKKAKAAAEAPVEAASEEAKPEESASE